jgi:hypothetical protein
VSHTPITIAIERMDGGPRLLIEDADFLAATFFQADASSGGLNAYDAYSGKGEPNRITDDDVTVINQTMRARSPHDKWTELTTPTEPLKWLAAIEPAWELFGMSPLLWEQSGCTATIEKALGEAVASYRNLSMASKILHLKRPAFFPVLDSLVVEQIGGTSEKPIELILQIREQGRANLRALGIIQAELKELELDGKPIVRTRVRILDALLWTSHPQTSLPPKELNSWERVMRRRGQVA